MSYDFIAPGINEQSIPLSEVCKLYESLSCSGTPTPPIEIAAVNN